MADSITTSLAGHGLTTAARSVPYPAIPREEWLLGDPDLFQSVDQGRIGNRLLVHLAVSQCGPGIRIVLIGYSQGAAAARAGAGWLAADDVSAVAGLIVIADPGYDPATAGVHVGGADPNKHGFLAGPADYELPTAIAENTLHICLPLDPVCQSNDWGDLAENTLLHGAVHSAGYQDPPAAWRAAAADIALGGYRCAGRRPTIVGTPSADHLVGTPGPDVIVGLGGDDVVDGLDGGDAICTVGADGEEASGHDVINPGDGNDFVQAGAGPDTVAGDEGNDYVQAGAGDDDLTGGQGSDYLAGGAGDDSLTTTSDDYADGGSGDDDLDGTAGSNVLDGGDGADLLIGSSSADYLDAGSGDDILRGEGGADYLQAGVGTDHLVAGPGSAFLDGGDGDDDLDGGIGDNYLSGGDGADDLDGGGGTDGFDGGPGDDLLQAVDLRADQFFSCGDGSDELHADAVQDAEVPRNDVCEAITTTSP